MVTAHSSTQPAAIKSSLGHTEIVSLSSLYQIFFLYLEPVSTLVGAYYAHLRPRTYLALTHAASAPQPPSLVPTSTSVVLSQLANLYFLFALNEGLVLRSTNDLKVWRTLLFGLLVADLGHLYSLWELGMGKYWQVWEWNAMDGGNIGFVYLGAVMRISFLLGLGVNARQVGEKVKK
jgi:hypothetical protein